MDVEVVGIDGNETPYQVTYKVANSSAFLFWKLPLLYGSRLPEKEDEIIVSASFARKIAGGDNPVGRVVPDCIADLCQWYYGLLDCKCSSRK